MTTQLILALPQTPVTFASVGLGNVLWTPTNIALGNGRLSSVWDRGAGAVPRLYRWRCSTRWVATPAANDRFTLYLIEASAPATPALTDGGLTLGDASLTSEAELIVNCYSFGSVLATAVDKIFCRGGVILLAERYIALAGWNGSATKALSVTAADHICSFTPIPDEIQAPT